MNISLNETAHRHTYIFFYVFPSVLLVTPLGMPSNVLVLRALLGKPGICSTSEIFTVSQALMDLAFIIGLLGEIIHSAVANRLTLHSLVFNQIGGPLHFVSTCVDTYLGVLHPVVFMRLKAPAYRISICMGMWAITTGCFIATLFIGRIWVLVISVLAVSSVVMYFCLIQVLWTLSQPGPGGTTVHPVKKRAFKTVLTLFILIIIHYTLPVVNYAVAKSTPSSNDFKPFNMISYTFQSLSSCIKPILFLAKANKTPLPLACQSCRA